MFALRLLTEWQSQPRRPAATLALVLLVTVVAACSSSGATGAQKTATLTAQKTATPTPSGWIPGPSVPKGALQLAVAPSDPRVAYVCNDSDPQQVAPGPRIFKTTDRGATWSPVATVPHPDMPCTVFLDQNDASDLFLQQVLSLGEPPTVTKYLWRSRDGGQSWHQLTLLDHTLGWSTLAVFGMHIVARAISNGGGPGAGCPDPHPVTAAPYTRLYASDDGGATWQPLGQSIENLHLGVFDFTLMGTTIVASARTLVPDCTLPTSSLWTSADAGATWQKLDFPGGLIGYGLTFAQAPSGAYYGVADVFGFNTTSADSNATTLLYTTDSGVSWRALPPYVSPQPSHPTVAEEAPGPLVTSSGAVVSRFTLPYGPNGFTPTDILVIHPDASSPTWTWYAPNHPPVVANAEELEPVNTWQVVPLNQGSAIWLLDWQTGTSWYLPLP